MRRKPYKRNKYFPNNVRAIQDAPDNIFIPVPFNELINWKVHGYELPDSVWGHPYIYTLGLLIHRRSTYNLRPY